MFKFGRQNSLSVIQQRQSELAMSVLNVFDKVLPLLLNFIEGDANKRIYCVHEFIKRINLKVRARTCSCKILESTCSE